MAARSVRCLFSNQTDFSLNHVEDGHSSGQFTDPWYPPALIQPHQLVEWRSESDEFLSGAIGHAKYSILIGDQSSGHLEYVQVSWDNPYIGSNSCDIRVTNDFSGTPSQDVQAGSFIQTGTMPNAIKVANMDVEAWLDTLLFPPYIIANAVSYNDTNAFYGICVNAPPQGPDFSFGDVDPGPRSQKLNTNANPVEWAGEWGTNNIFVTLADHGNGRMGAYITDGSTAPMLQFSQDFNLGGLTWVARHALNYALINHFANGLAPVSKLLTTAVFETMKGIGSHSLSIPQIAEQFRQVASEVARTGSTRISSRKLHQSSVAVATAIASVRATVQLMNGVCLTLYDVFYGSTKREEVLYYQRVDSVGNVLYSATLKFIPYLH